MAGMQKSTRQQRRARDRARRGRHDRLFSEGIPPSDDFDRSAILVHHLAGILSSPRDRRRASRAAEAAHRVFDRSLEAVPPDKPVACQKGCAYCCYNAVSATIPEVLLVAAQISGRTPGDADATIRRVTESGQATRDLTGAARGAAKIPCPLLVDNACSAYSSRPLSCRAFASHSLDSCERCFDDPAVGIPVPVVQRAYRSSCSTALWAALKAAGLPYGSYELIPALQVALEIEDAEGRWLSGEDVFASVTVDTGRDPRAEILLDQLIDAALT